MSRLFSCFILAAAVTACASSGSTGMTGERISTEQRQGSANVITAAEIKAQSFKNVWQAIISLRPAWPQIGAYVDQRRMQFERLQEVPADSVKEIRLLSREQARVRFGPEAQQTIHVITR